MSHPNRRLLRLGRSIAKPYLASCNKLVAEAKERDAKTFLAELTKAGSAESLQRKQQIDRPQSKATVKHKTINVIYDLRESSPKYGKAYAFKSNKLTVDKMQSRLNCIRIDGAIALLCSKKHGLQLNLGRYGFRFSDSPYRHGERKTKVWYGLIDDLDIEKLLTDYPELKGLI